MSAYPPQLPTKITDGSFTYWNNLHLTRSIKAVKGRKGKEDADYIVGSPYLCSVIVEIDGKNHRHLILVPQGFLTDLSSAPRIFRSYVSRVGPHLEASIVHDWLYVAWQHEGLEPTEGMRLFADDVFLAAMKKAKVGSCKRWLIYRASRRCGPDMFYEKDDHLFAEWATVREISRPS